MSYRFTNTDKWNDAWFSTLNPNEKLLFIFLCDNCDVAGFIEINVKIWQVHTGLTEHAIKGALKGLQRGLIVSDTNDCIYIKNFLKHQKNLPLNAEKNMAHRGIVKRFDVYKDKFNIDNIETFLEAPSKPLDWGYGIGNGIGNDNGSSVKDGVIIKNVDQYRKWQSESNNETYQGFIDWLIERDPKFCLSLGDQITEQKFSDLLKMDGATKDKLKIKIMNIEGWRDNRKYKHFYAALKNWMS